MRNILFALLLFVSNISFGQIRDYNIVVNPLSKDDPYILSSDTSGTYRGRAQFHTIQYTANLLKPYLGCIDTAFIRNDSLFIYTTDLDSIAFAGGAGLTDGDKGDITVSGSGTNWQIDALAVDDNELQLTGVVAGQYNYPAVLKVNSKGRVTEVVAGSAPLDTFSYLATQSDISGFLSSVSHDNTLTGNGTVADPLKVDSSKIATQYDISGFLSSESQGIDDVLAIGQNLSADRTLNVNDHQLNYDLGTGYFNIYTDAMLGFPLVNIANSDIFIGDYYGAISNTYFGLQASVGSILLSADTLITLFSTSVNCDNLSHNLKFAINKTNPTQALDVVGNGLFSGTLTASNLSGTNTGDQDLSGLLLKSDTASMLAHFLERNNNLSDLTNTTTARSNLGLGTLATQSGTFSGTHSGTSSGTNTGDQTFTNSSDATSHTVTLSASGGSVQLVEGSNITLTTTGTAGDGIVTIASTGGAGYTDEQAQDAVGAMVNTSLTYVDGTPSLALTSRNINGTAFNGTANISVPASGKTFTWDGNGGIPATGSTIYWVVPTNCTLTGWSFWATGSSPTATIDVWKIAAGTALPAVGNTIISGTKPALSSGNVVRSSTLSAFTDTTFDAGEIIGINLDAVTVTTLLQFQLEFN